MKKIIWLFILTLLGCTTVGPQDEVEIKTELEVVQDNNDNTSIRSDNLVVSNYKGIESLVEEYFDGTFQYTKTFEETMFEEYDNIIIFYDNFLYSELPPSIFGLPTLESGDLYTRPSNDKANLFILRTSSLSVLESILSQLVSQDNIPNELVSAYDYFNRSGTLVYSDFADLEKDYFLDLIDLNSTTFSTMYSQQQFAGSQRIIIAYKKSIPYDVKMSLNIDDLEESSVVRIILPNNQEFILIHVPDAYEDLFFNELRLEWSNISSTAKRLVLKADIEIANEGSLLSASYCKIPSTTAFNNVSTAFPISDKRLPSEGTVNIDVIFIDFDEFPGKLTEEQMISEIQKYSDKVDDFYSKMSNGKVSLVWRIHPEFIRYPRSINDVNMTRNQSSVYASDDIGKIVRDSISLADNNVDFTNSDMVIVYVNPTVPFELADVSPAMPEEEGSKYVTNEADIYNATFIARDLAYVRPDGTSRGYTTIAHEMGHLFGLADLYNYFDDGGAHKFIGGWDMMGDIDNKNLELLAWQRYLLGWVEDEQVNCINPEFMTETSFRVNVEPLNGVSSNRMILIRLDANRLITIEKKMQGDYCVVSCNGDLLVTVVDGRIANGSGPIQVLRPADSTASDYYDSLISLNQSITFENVTIKHVENYPNVSVVEVIIDN
jgi:M6 family metalloprotease-like protein